MTRLRIFLVSLAVAMSLVGSASAPPARAAGSGVDPSDVVFVFDFSTSMRLPKGNTKANATAKALDILAGKIRAIQQKLIKKSPIIHMLHFANAVDEVPGCETVKTNNPLGVEKFADCLELVADEYRGNLSSWNDLGIAVQDGTNYGVAFDKAFSLMQGGSNKRPAVVFFTDGLNLPDDKQPPEDWIDSIVSSAESENLNPRAILPVGLALTGKPVADLEELYAKGTNLLKCNEEVGGEIVSWPRVNFSSAASAAEAIAQAFSRVVCVDVVTPDAPEDVEAITDGESTTVTWGDLPKGSIDAEGYEVICGGVSETVGAGSSSAVLPIGDAKDCTVASTITNAEGDEVSGTPSEKVPVISPPQPPQKPSVSPGDSSIGAETKPGEGADGKPADGGAPIDGYKWECTDVATGQPVASAESTGTEATVTGVSNGSEYTCSATAVNKAGESKPSEQSDSVKPCSGILGCNPWLLPLLILLLIAAIIAAILFALWLWRERTRGYVTAIIDGHPAFNLNRGPQTGFSFVGTSADGVINGAQRDIQSTAHVSIQNLGGDRFKWSDRTTGTSGVVERGGTFSVADPSGGTHQIRLRAFGRRPKNMGSSITWGADPAGAVGGPDWGGSGATAAGWGSTSTGWDEPGTGGTSGGGGWG
jgi:hypothetical protein